MMVSHEILKTQGSSESEHLDLSYLCKYGNRKIYAVPTSFAKCAFTQKQSFLFRCTNVYDPSKFWIVPKYRELALFQKYLFRTYYVNRKKYKVPIKKLELQMYCVAFCDGGYFRGVIVGFKSDELEDEEFQIFLIDYGTLKIVNSNNIFYMSEKLFHVPQFCIRASLAGVCPKSNRGEWTANDVADFQSMVSDKILRGVVVHSDPEQQVLEIHFGEESDGLMKIPVHKMLIKQNRACYVHERVEPSKELTTRVKLKYSYLFPSHEALECGKVPSNIGDAEFQVQLALLTVPSVLTRYYKNRSES